MCWVLVYDAIIELGSLLGPYSPQLEKSLHSNDNSAQLKINNKNFKKKCGIVKKNSRVRDLRVQRKERIPPPGGRARDFRKSI